VQIDARLGSRDVLGSYDSRSRYRLRHRRFLQILDYLEKTYPTPALYPSDAAERHEVVRWTLWLDSTLGLTVRLRLLGASWLDQSLGLKVTSVYGLIVLALAALAGWKGRSINLSNPAGRALLVQTGLALMSLASFRSPFVGGLYGFVAALWLLTLLAGSSRNRQSAVLWSIAFVTCAVVNRLTPSPSFPATTLWLVASGGIFVLALGASAWAVLRLILSRTSGSPPAGALEAAGT
jgi:hypothetical protein